MKLKNKKTGEILELCCHRSGDYREKYNSLAELNEEWEDYEEPKDYWWISPVDTDAVHCVEDVKDEMDQYNKEIGNYFETREEAELAVRKLKAWKRLKDKGFRFILDGETEMPMFVYSGANGEKCITSAEESKQCRDDIKSLFGGQE